jgi:DNA-binding NtrC family response regulator
MVKILVVDDEEKICTSLCKSLWQHGFNATSATCGVDAKRMLLDNEVSAVVLDLRLGRENGLELLPDFLKIRPGIPVIMLTAFADVDTAVAAMKIGAVDYLKKPIRIPDLIKVLEDVDSCHSRERFAACGSRETNVTLGQFVTRNTYMLDLIEKAMKVARSDLPILIQGESGTGKEVFAELIHGHSDRRKLPMQTVNCSALPESLLDNELFGHERGAFTGADKTAKGLFEQAEGSTLFLDELGDMPLTLQCKILRTIQNHEIRRIGGGATIHIDVRFIAATNQNLERLIKERKFREDLYYRLNMAPFVLLPLRERREDIIPLAEHFLEEIARGETRHTSSVSDEVKEILLTYAWPGNIRELKSVMQFAATIASGDPIQTKDLPPFMKSFSAARSSNGASLKNGERSIIIGELEKNGYNIKRTAEILDISRATLYKKMMKYEIDKPTGR